MVMTDRRERRILGVKVEQADDLGRVVSALDRAGEKGSADYAVARRSLILAARELDEIKSLPAEWGVTEDSDGIEYKAFPAAATTVVDEVKGEVEAFVAITGTEDKVADIIYPEAIEYALKERTPKGVWHHDWKQPIAKTLEAKALAPGDPALPAKTRDGSPWPAEAGAMWVHSAYNLGTTRGKDAFNDIVFFGDDQEYSIGYRIPRGGAKVDKNGVRHIKQLIIPEYSPVLFGAHPLTSTGSVKHELAGRGPEDEPEVKVEREGVGTATLTGTLAIDAKDEDVAPGAKDGTVHLYLSGSDEERIDKVTDAIDAWLASSASGIDMMRCCARVVGTFGDRVVFCVMTFGDYNGEPMPSTPDLPSDDNYFQANYSIEGDQAMLAEVAPVDITTAIAAKDEGGPLEFKVGRMFSRANLQKMKAAHAALAEMLTLAEPPEADKKDEVTVPDEKSHLTIKMADDADPAMVARELRAAAEKVETTGRLDGKAEPDPEMQKKPHAYEAGPDGKCAVCGAAEASPMHAAGEKAEGDAPAEPDPAMQKKPHAYKAGEDGKCATCGAAEASPMHNVKGEPEGETKDEGSELPADLVADMLEAERLRDL